MDMFLGENSTKDTLIAFVKRERQIRTEKLEEKDGEFSSLAAKG